MQTLSDLRDLLWECNSGGRRPRLREVEDMWSLTERLLRQQGGEANIAFEANGVAWINRERLIAVLKEHWLTHIKCDHESKTDKAFCACSEMGGEECNSVGGAVQTWIDHVLEQL